MKGACRRGFSMTELLVVIGVIIVLIGLLFAALSGVRVGGSMTKSMAKLRQIGAWISLYSTENRDTVLPSQFDYTGHSYKGKVRSEPNPPTQGSGADFSGPECAQHCGTWTDILWSVYVNRAILEAPQALDEAYGNYLYQNDSPDGQLQRAMGDDLESPFRSAAPNSHDSPLAPGGYLQWETPFGHGATEKGLPGYFAANNYFNTRTRWVSTGQVKAPERSMYVVDSFAGETIEPQEDMFLMRDPTSSEPPPGQVDFRYNDTCLMLMLDAHVEPVGFFDNICDLEGEGTRLIRIRNLTDRVPRCQQ